MRQYSAHLRRLVLFVVLPLAAFALPPAADARPALFARTVQDLQVEQREATRQGQQLAVLFGQADCPACTALQQRVLKQPSAAPAARDWRMVAVRLDDGGLVTTPTGEQVAPTEFASRLRVPGTPAIAFFGDDGRLLYRHLGPLRDGKDLVLLARFVREAKYEELPFAAYQRQMRRPATPAKSARYE